MTLMTTSPLEMIDNTALERYCSKLAGEVPFNNRILFIQIPQIILSNFEREIALKRGYYAFPPTGLQYIYESIKHRGFEIRILDINYAILEKVFHDETFDVNNWPDLLEAELDGFQPGIVGVSCLFDMGIKPLIEVLRRARARGNSILIAGGVIATYEHQSLLSDALAHFVVRGEGEYKINFLLDHLTGNLGNDATTGIFFDDGNGLKESVGRPDTVSVKGSLISSYDLVPIEKYCQYGSLNPFSRRFGEAIPFAPIQFSRGCRAECTFCSVRDFMGKSVRCRSVDDVIAEIEYLYNQKGVRHIEWLDDDLLFYRHEIKELFRRLIDKKWDLHWSANNGLIAASIDEEMIDLIERSGCIGFKIGIETGNEEMLRKVKKPGKHSKFLQFSELLRNHPTPFVGGNFIVGFPGETVLQLMDSFRFALEMDLDWSAFTVCQAIRGASAFSEAGEYFQNQMKTDGAVYNNFIPTRQANNGKLTSGSNIRHGLEIFSMLADDVPNQEQVKEIWFTFNILVNYIHNKNLRIGGHPQKFINWVAMAQRAYPTNPYMMLFCALAHRIQGENDRAQECLVLARSFCTPGYWQERFDAFHLTGLVTDFPSSSQAVFDRLSTLWERLSQDFGGWMGALRGVAPASSQR